MASLADRLDDAAATSQPQAHVEYGPDGGEFTNIISAGPITSWDSIFEKFDLDPADWEIVDDTVRIGVWEQSKRLENGDRDTVKLHSYRAQFRRRLAGLVDVPAVIESLRAWKPPKPTRTPLGQPVALFLGWADWQLGKGEGDGTAGTTQRILDGFEATEKHIRTLRAQGVNVNEIVFANMGDHTEAVVEHYASQTYSVDLNQRDQLALAVELNMTGIKALAPLVDKSTYAACLCNHGQWVRKAGKQITDDADNATGFIGDVLHTICSLHPALENIDWIVPRDEMITTGVFAGVPTALAHGHKISGNEETWLSKQTSWLHSTKDFRPELWVTAHRHTAINQDFGPYSRVQCATNDPGSKSFTDGTGKFSTRGTTTFVIDANNSRRISHYEVI